MSNWIIALPRPDMEHCLKIGLFGRNSRQGIAKVKQGDNIVCYVTKECKIIALGKATSDYFLDDEAVFKAEGLFPDRFRFKADTLDPKREIDIKTMVDDLTFITNKAYWSVFFRAGIKQIPDEDLKLIRMKTGKA